MDDMEAVGLHAFSGQRTRGDAILAQGWMARFRRHNPNTVIRSGQPYPYIDETSPMRLKHTATGPFAKPRYLACITLLPRNILSSGKGL
jgi:hypothetical protein